MKKGAIFRKVGPRKRKFRHWDMCPKGNIETTAPSCLYGFLAAIGEQDLYATIHGVATGPK